jgi:hypothetical protein
MAIVLPLFDTAIGLAKAHLILLLKLRLRRSSSSYNSSKVTVQERGSVEITLSGGDRTGSTGLPVPHDIEQLTYETERVVLGVKVAEWKTKQLGRQLRIPRSMHRDTETADVSRHRHTTADRFAPHLLGVNPSRQRQAIRKDLLTFC